MLRSHEEMQSGSPPFSGLLCFGSSKASALTMSVGVPGLKGTFGRFFIADFSNGEVGNSEVVGLVKVVEVGVPVRSLPLLDFRDVLEDSDLWVSMAVIGIGLCACLAEAGSEC